MKKKQDWLAVCEQVKALDRLTLARDAYLRTEPLGSPSCRVRSQRAYRLSKMRELEVEIARLRKITGIGAAR